MRGHRHTSADGGASVPAAIRRGWPIVLVVAAVAVGATVFALERRSPTYEATTRMLVTPLPQWDTTFLGTGLIRDAGDASRTASTVAQLLDSRAVAGETARHVGHGWTTAGVRDAVNVAPVGDTNVIGVTARADTRGRAMGLAREYAKAAIAVHWRTVVAGLDARIATLAGVRRTTAPDNADLGHDLALLRALRLGGADPTLTLRETTAATRTGISATAAAILALLGGLFLGALAAVAIARLPRSAKAEERAGSDDGLREPNVSYRPE